jgi:hypothetical protein
MMMKKALSTAADRQLENENQAQLVNSSLVGPKKKIGKSPLIGQPRLFGGKLVEYINVNTQTTGSTFLNKLFYFIFAWLDNQAGNPFDNHELYQGHKSPGSSQPGHISYTRVTGRNKSVQGSIRKG